MKTTLSIEQSARLIELGVDANKASMVSWKQTENWQRKSVLGDKEHLQLKPFQPMVMGFERFDCKDIFTLTDILSILPKEIYSEERDLSYFLTMVMPPHKCQAYYHRYSPKGFGPIMKAPELIDSLYQLLIWCLEQGHCKCGKEVGDEC